VIEELDMAEYGARRTTAIASMFAPFEHGSSIQLWDDDARCEDEVRKLAPEPAT
jgi:hypothetical protein